MLMFIIGLNVSTVEIMVAIIAFLFAIMIALVLHEWAHAWAAYKSGDPTAKVMGRMTLNPAAHIDPMGVLFFLLAGIGWAKPVPVNPFNYRNFKRGNFFVSIAGVTVNLILGFFFSLGWFVLLHFGDIEQLWQFALFMFFMLGMVMNLSLMIFNLLPIPPLDGYNLLVSITKPDNGYMKWARDNAQMLLIMVLVVSMLTGGIFLLRDGIIWLFEGLWRLIFRV